MKKSRQFITFLMLTLALPVLSVANPVKPNSSISGNKIVVTQDRQVTSFHAIKVSGGIDVVLSQGKDVKLQVEADENLMAAIRTEVKDGVLKIYHENNIQYAKTMKIYLTFQNIDAIIASGGCDIESKQKLGFATLKMDISGGCDIKLDFRAGSLICKQSGGCDVILSGEAESGNFNVSGGSDVKASELYLKNCTIEASGGSDVSVHVTGELTIEASGSSDITYYGKPAKVIKSAHGSSDINGR